MDSTLLVVGLIAVGALTLVASIASLRRRRRKATARAEMKEFGVSLKGKKIPDDSYPLW